MVALLGSSLARAQPDAQTPASPALAGTPTLTGMLIRIRTRAIENLNRMPNYTCTETVERSHRPKSTHKFELLDTIRLEVALVDGKEMYAWPGAAKFDDVELSHFVTGGAIGNGSFALHARAVFSGEATHFEYTGTGTTGNRSWIRFHYDVPLARSGYTLRSGQEKALVGFHGSFDVDPQSLDLERIVVIADQIPPRLQLEKAVTAVDYSRIKIGETDFLLPTGSELSMVNVDATENRNQIRFTSCRQFSGQSVLRFDDAPDTSSTLSTSSNETAEIVLPVGLVLTLALIDDVELAKGAIGDPVRARLQNDLKWKGRVLMPKGAVATGRLMRIERHSDSVMVGVTFDELDAPGLRAKPSLRLNDVMTADHIAARGRYLTAPIKSGEGILPLAAGRVKLNRGLLMNWSTEEPTPKP